MAKVVNRASQSVTSTGTGTLTLGPAVLGFQTFEDAGAIVGDTLNYVIQDGDAFEYGRGVFSGSTLTRQPIHSSEVDSGPISVTTDAIVFSTVFAQDLGKTEVTNFPGDFETVTLFSGKFDENTVSEVASFGNKSLMRIKVTLTDDWTTGTYEGTPYYELWYALFNYIIEYSKDGETWSVLTSGNFDPSSGPGSVDFGEFRREALGDCKYLRVVADTDANTGTYALGAVPLSEMPRNHVIEATFYSLQKVELLSTTFGVYPSSGEFPVRLKTPSGSGGVVDFGTPSKPISVVLTSSISGSVGVTNTNANPVPVSIQSAVPVTVQTASNDLPVVPKALNDSSLVQELRVTNSGYLKVAEQVVTVSPTDRSGTIATGGAAQTLMASNASRKGFWIQNLSSGDLYFSATGAASAGGSSIKLAAGALYEAPVHGIPDTSISIFGTTTGQAFSSNEW